MKKEKAYKKVNEVSEHQKYQLQHWHGTLSDYAYKVTDFIEQEVDTDLGNYLSDILRKIQKDTKNNKS